jgi:hypothetical protein
VLLTCAQALLLVFVYDNAEFRKLCGFLVTLVGYDRISESLRYYIHVYGRQKTSGKGVRLKRLKVVRELGPRQFPGTELYCLPGNKPDYG